MSKLSRSLASQERHLTRRSRSLARLQEAGKVREAACQRFDQDAWRAVDWLRQNQDKFKGKIYEPARLNLFLKKDFNGRKLDVRDQSLVSMIEGPISMNAFSVSCEPEQF